MVGLGGLVGTAGLTFGTGAFSSAEITRESNITVVNDSDALLALIPNEEIAGVYTDSGELTIDIGKENGGVNINSVYQFGEFVKRDGVDHLTEGTFTLVTDDNPADISNNQESLESAFAIVNHTSRELEITVSFKINDDIEDRSDTMYAFELQTSKGNQGERIAKTTSPIDNGTAFTETLSVGDSFGVSFLVNSLGGTTDDEISGTLTVSAAAV
ncbi:hypothetical protein [Halorubrum lipolyticum]|uniref:Uncharacterized protein n=1 Tax=Halorubrum lipolyticum DSM 21995 TaxID=1227482 RepID=M0NK08_9EURY|nr:hypothetical protein [Halorubrum lipolyticum]EMA58322.1 hypothetical protein C469_13970 [Halorubrum lipolyticum DSM 21995]